MNGKGEPPPPPPKPHAPRPRPVQSVRHSPPPRDVLEGGEGGGSEAGGGRGVWLGPPPPPRVPLWPPPKAGQRILRLKSSWHRSKILTVSLKHWKGRMRRGGGSREGGDAPSSNGVRPF